METKHLTSMRLSTEAKQLLAALAAKLSISQAAVLELAIRDMARRVKITAPPLEERSPRR